MLAVNDLHAGYGDVDVLFGVDLQIEDAKAVALVGSNGVGKTTLLRVISGLLQAKKGQVLFDGQDISGIPAYERVNLGIVQIPQGRGILSAMTVEENMIMGTYNRRTKAMRKQLFQETIEIFPRLKERLRQQAGTLSGGEQQMLAIARALMMRPKLLIMDEPSLGLAPKLVDEVFGMIADIRSKGASLLIVEQNLLQALNVTDYAYVMETGKITITGLSSELAERPEIRKAYLGI